MPAIPRHKPGYSFGTGRTQDHYTIERVDLKGRTAIFSAILHLSEMRTEYFLLLHTLMKCGLKFFFGFARDVRHYIGSRNLEPAD